MHYVRPQIIGAHRLKRPRTDVQCYKGAAHTPRLYFPNKLRIEVQTRCGRSNGTPFARKDTLITLPVIGISCTVNVRWKRYIAPLLEEFKRRPGKSDAPQIILTTEDPHDAPCSRHLKAFAYRFACAQLYNSLFGPDDSLQEDLHATAGRFRPQEPRRNHFRVVENKEIAGAQEAWEVAYGAVARDGTTLRPLDNKQPTRRSLGERNLSDQVGRQVVGEVMALHGRMVLQSLGRCRVCSGLAAGTRARPRNARRRAGGILARQLAPHGASLCALRQVVASLSFRIILTLCSAPGPMNDIRSGSVVSTLTVFCCRMSFIAIFSPG